MTYLQAYQTMQKLCSPAIEPGLDRILALLQKLGQPQQGLQVIHVAGTNGKGSVCAMLEAILLADGKRVGLYTSPHLHDFRERFRLNSNMIDTEVIASHLARLNQVLEKLSAEGGPQPTEFEAATALAFCIFQEAKPDWLILEVGLGGTYDATNVVEASIAVITNIGRDHMEYLGEDLAGIAREKAGIIKPGAQVFTAAQGAAWPVIATVAQARQANLFSMGQELAYSPHEHDTYGQRFTARTDEDVYPSLTLPLLGEHQLENATLAVATAEAAGASENAIRRGLWQVNHPGRLEVLSRQPLVVMDGAHNEPGLAALAQALADYWPGLKVLGLLGMLADKERKQALAHLVPHLAGAIISRPPLYHRSKDWQHLATVCAEQGLPIPAENIIEDIPQACARALELLPQYDMLLVCGSLYLVAEARAYLIRHLPAKAKSSGGK